MGMGIACLGTTAEGEKTVCFPTEAAATKGFMNPKTPGNIRMGSDGYITCEATAGTSAASATPAATAIALALGAVSGVALVM